MKLENQVCCLDLSKRLKELGVKQESYFYWNTEFSKPKVVDRTRIVTAPIYFGDKYVSSFTVAELGEMLPENTSTFKEPVGKREWVCTRNEPSVMLSFRENTEADARAKMLVYLLENKLITL